MKINYDCFYLLFAFLAAGDSVCLSVLRGSFSNTLLRSACWRLAGPSFCRTFMMRSLSLRNSAPCKGFVKKSATISPVGRRPCGPINHTGLVTYYSKIRRLANQWALFGTFLQLTHSLTHSLTTGQLFF